MRTTRSAEELTPSLRAIVHEVNPLVPLRNIESMDGIAATSMADSRFETQLVTIFSALALLVAAVGTYGVTRVLQKSLFDVTPTDPATLAAVVCVLLLGAVIAGFAPTRRALRIDPMAALREE